MAALSNVLRPQLLLLLLLLVQQLVSLRYLSLGGAWGLRQSVRAQPIIGAPLAYPGTYLGRYAAIHERPALTLCLAVFPHHISSHHIHCLYGEEPNPSVPLHPLRLYTLHGTYLRFSRSTTPRYPRTLLTWEGRTWGGCHRAKDPQDLGGNGKRATIRMAVPARALLVSLRSTYPRTWLYRTVGQDE